MVQQIGVKSTSNFGNTYFFSEIREIRREFYSVRSGKISFKKYLTKIVSILLRLYAATGLLLVLPASAAAHLAALLRDRIPIHIAVVAGVPAVVTLANGCVRPGRGNATYTDG